MVDFIVACVAVTLIFILVVGSIEIAKSIGKVLRSGEEDRPDYVGDPPEDFFEEDI